METKNVLQKIFEARQKIKQSKLKKAGRNTYSEYDYFTPEQVSMLVDVACNDMQLLNTFELKRTELGLVAQLTVWNLEDKNDFQMFSMATEMPSIKATNVAQQLGGAVTYSERYLLMATYDIKDNNLDFDASKKPSDKPEKKKESNQTNFVTREIKPSELEKWKGKVYAGNIIYLGDDKIQLSKEQHEKILKHPNYKPDDKN